VNEALIIAIIGLLAAPVASLITWMANKKKNVGDIYATLSDSAQTMVEAMQGTMETLHDELLAAQEKIERLIQENQKMQAELSKLRQQNLLLLQENHSLHQKIDDLVSILHDTGELPVVSDHESSQNGN
jgi:predicted  nucleic acid-binding Zn-ribbon protein